MRRLLLLAPLAFALGACEAQREARWMAEADASCTQYGFTPGTPEHAQCKMLVVENKHASRDAALAVIASGGMQPVKPSFTCMHNGPFLNCR